MSANPDTPPLSADVDIDTLISDAVDFAAQQRKRCVLCATPHRAAIDELIRKGRERGISWDQLAHIISSQPSWGLSVSWGSPHNHGKQHLRVG